MEIKNKVCPLNPKIDKGYYCHELCAWWDEDSQKCAILVLARAMKERK